MFDFFMMPGSPGHLIVAAILIVAFVFIAITFSVRDSRAGKDWAHWVVLGIVGSLGAPIWPVVLVLVLGLAALTFVLSPVILLAV